MRRSGAVPRWVVVLVVPPLLLAPLIAYGVMRSAWPYLPTTTIEAAPPAWLLRLGPAALCAALLAGWLAVPQPVPRLVRATVLLCVVYAGLIAWATWMWFHVRDNAVRDGVEPLAEGIAAPVLAVLAGAVLAGAIWTAFAARRRAPDWLRVLVGVLLTYLLLIGLTLPLLAWAWPEGYGESRLFAKLVLGVPAVLVLVVGAVVWLQPARRVSWAVVGPIAHIAAVAGGAAALGFADRLSVEIYGRFSYVLTAAVSVALVATAMYALLLWLSLRVGQRRTPRGDAWVQRGRVVADGDKVGWVRNGGWFGGLRTEVGAFRLRTEHGLLEVPAGSRLIAPVPVWTVNMRVGQRVPVLRAGDEVVVSGFVEPAGAGPYRRAAAPVPGSAGLVIAPVERHGAPLRQDVLLCIWRPCVVFLAAVAVVAAPAAVALLRSVS